MAPPRLYERPNEQLFRLMAAGKRVGLSFDEAWRRAVRPGLSLVMTNTKAAPPDAVRWPTDRTDRLACQAAIFAARDGWKRAYEDVPMSAAEQALVVLGAELGWTGTDRGMGGLVAVTSAA